VDETVSRRALHFPQGSPAVYLKYKKKKQKDKDVFEICDLNYRSPSVNLMGFAIGRDEKYL